ncbi:hypothetical protein ACFL02_09030 [Planctomycetota bacterium]
MRLTPSPLAQLSLQIQHLKATDDYGPQQGQEFTQTVNVKPDPRK